MREVEDAIIYSPSDLVVFLESPYASWCDRRKLAGDDDLVADEDDPMLQVLAKRGVTHEKKYLAQLRADGKDVCVVEGKGQAGKTRKAIAESREIIFQARLVGGQFAGYADFLMRIPDGEPASYAIWDTKLSRHTKPYFMIQLCCYADMLEVMTGRRTEVIGIILGDGQEHSFRTSGYFAYYERIKASFLALMSRFPEGEAPVPVASANHGKWASNAKVWLEEQDHLSQVANISKGQIARLNGVGVGTMTALASECPSYVTGIAPASLGKLGRQAWLQVHSAQLDRPLFDVLQPPKDNPALGLAALPPQSSLDVFFDMEGYPAADDWLDYLFGVVVIEEGQPKFYDWWAHSDNQEKKAFEEFIDWVYERWLEDPTMHIYHYAAYETHAAKRLMGKYGTREDKVDNLLRNKVFIDLYDVVRRGIMVGEPSYSIKNLEHLYMPKRVGGVTDAGTSVAVYDAWCESDESEDWRKSERLKAVRDYNEDDCLSTELLATWLREQQTIARISWAGVDPSVSNEKAQYEETEATRERRELAEEMLASLPDVPPVGSESAEAYRVKALLAYLLEFHRRAEKPMWWVLFERFGKTNQELWDDMDCLSGLKREGAGRTVKQSQCFDYTFDPDQDTKLRESKTICFVPDIGAKATIDSFQLEGKLTLKISNKKLDEFDLDGLPFQTSIVPYEYISAGPLLESIYRVVKRYVDTGHLKPALADFIGRLPPRLCSGENGNLRRDDEEIVAAATRIARDLDSSCLCMQGPPGTGKTYTAARVILALIESGKSVAISANSHAAILNLMAEVLEHAGDSIIASKVGGDENDPAFNKYPNLFFVKQPKDVEGKRPEASLIGATAWFFAREKNVDSVDYLFIDEAGQVSVANLVAMSPAAKNIVLLGDQMQLGQPVQGSHPGDSGESILEYYLQGHDTIPPDRGLFLDVSWRMHPGVCSFISEAVYESRLQAVSHTANRVVQLPSEGVKIVKHEAGILFVPVEHEGNSQSSDEEVAMICRIIDELIGRQLTDKEGKKSHLVSISEDILLVSPYNMQVRKLKNALPEGARVASVDKFQGQEAPIVIVSMCASPGEFGSRGMKFVLDKNRMNVAISRAQSLAIVVGDPRLAESDCSSVQDMELLNLCCWIQSAGNPSNRE